jgi:hypothetical protein
VLVEALERRGAAEAAEGGVLRRRHGWRGGAVGAGLGGVRRKGECLNRGRPDHGDAGVMPRP